MVLNDDEIEQYIEQDLAEAQKMDVKDLTPYLKKIIDEKEMFKAKLCQTVSILRLGYMFKVLQAVHPGKASMLGAEAFMYKAKKAERNNNKKNKFAIKAAGQKSMMSSIHSSGGGSQENITAGKTTDLQEPMLVGIDTFIDELTVKMKDAALAKMKILENIFKE